MIFMKKQQTQDLLKIPIFLLLILLSLGSVQAQLKLPRFLTAGRAKASCTHPPIITCPPTFHACPGVSTLPSNTGYATAVPGGLGCNQPSVSYHDNIVSTGPCNGAITIQRIWTAVDPQDPTLYTSCMQMVKLSDDTAPTITNCPADITIASNPDCYATVYWNSPTVTDNCGKLFLNVTHVSGDRFQVGITRVTYTAEDLCGNSSTCGFNITVTGNCCDKPPILTCPGDYSGCPGDSISPKKTGTPTVRPGKSTCAIPVLTYRDSGLVQGSCAGAMTFFRIWTARDPFDSSLVSHCTQKISFKDEIKPVFTSCPANLTLAPGTNCQASGNWISPVVTDNCGTPQITSTHQNGSSFNEGITTVVYTATDRCGNSATCSFTVTVTPCCTAPPIIQCPADYYGCPGTSTATTVTGQATASPSQPNCGTPLVSYNDKIISQGPCSGAIRIERTWIATNNVNNLQSSCVQLILLSDLIPPVFTSCPTNMTVMPNPGNCLATVSWTNPTVTDHCGAPQLTSSHPNPGDFPVGVTQVTITATDGCGNSSTCSFSITVNPCCNSNPVISCPQNYTACPGTSTNPSTTGTATATPGSPQCGIPAISYSDKILSQGPCAGAIEIKRTWKATDPNNSNLYSTCIQIVKLIDQTPPVFTSCPANVTIQPNSNCQAVYWWTPPTATDNCSTPQIVGSHQPGTIFNVGVTTVTYTATDGCGNVASHSFTVTVPNTCCNQPPIINCPAPYYGCPTQACGPGISGTATASKSSSQCGTPVVSYRDSILTTGPCYYAKKFIRIWKAVDPNYPLLVSYCHQLIELKDNTPPYFTSCPSNITVALNGACTKPISWNPPTAYDNCSNVQLSSNYQPGQSFGPGVYTIIYTATDVCGNKVTHSFTITVTGGGLDIVCPANITVTQNDPTIHGAYVSWNLPTVNSCGGCNDTLPGFIYMGTYNGHRYFCSLQPATWQSAHNICRSLGGNLASIGSAAENAWVQSKLMGATAFIGLHDSRVEGSFEWTDGSPLNYTNWYPGQPNNANGDQDFVEMLPDGTWNDQYTSCVREFICEMPCYDLRQISGPSNGGFFNCGTTTVTYVATLGSLSDTCSFTVTVNCTTTGGGNGYCISKGLDSRFMWINTVKFATINHTSGNNGGYANFTNICADVKWGNTYPICLEPGFANNTAYTVYWRIWIDYNGDQDFEDPGEFVAYGNGYTTLCGNITLPGNCVCPGITTRMRVAMSYGGYAGNSCCIYSYGEVEDYCINISPTFTGGGSNSLVALPDPVHLKCPGCPATEVSFEQLISRGSDPALESQLPEPVFSVSPNPAREEVLISSSNSPISSIQIFNSTGKMVWHLPEVNGTNFYRVDIQDWAAGAYVVHITSSEGNKHIQKLLVQK